jgi:hypothetical protein
MRALKRGAPEEKLAPGQSLHLTKGGGKRFTLTRIDDPPKDFLAGADEIMTAIPIEGPQVETDVVRAHLEAGE